MPRLGRFAAVPLILALCTALVLIAPRVTGVSMVPQSPTVVAVLNLDRLLGGLDRTAQVREDFRRRQDAIQASLQAKFEALNEAKAELADLVGTAQYDQRREQVRRQEAMLAAEQAYEFDRIRMEDAQAMQKMYMEIVEELRAFCETNKIDLVLIDSSPPRAFPRSDDGRILNNQQTLQAIASWETMYVGPRIDITDEFLSYMNR